MEKKKKNKKLNKFCSLFDYKYFLYDFLKVTGFLSALLIFRNKTIFVNKEYKKEFKRKPVMIASNHSSFIDPLVMLAFFYYKRVSIIATKDLFEGKFKHFLFTHVFQAICVDKENVSIKTFRQVGDVLNNRGHSVVIFPEGTVIHKTHEVEEFKPGVIVMSAMTKTPIYPMYIVERKHWYERKKIIIGEPFIVSEHSSKSMPAGEELNRVTNELFLKEKELEKLALEKYVKEK